MSVLEEEPKGKAEALSAPASLWLPCGGLSEIGLRTPGVNPGVKARSRRLQVFVQRF